MPFQPRGKDHAYLEINPGSTVVVELMGDGKDFLGNDVMLARAENGDTYYLPRNVVLLKKIWNLPEHTIVQITCTGEEKTKGGFRVKLFEVEVDTDSVDGPLPDYLPNELPEKFQPKDKDGE